MERDVLYAVAVDLPNVKIFFHFWDVLGWYPICCAPGSGRSRGVLKWRVSDDYERRKVVMSVYLISERFPQLTVNQRAHSARGFRGASMVFAV
jgi:hypothetical protein